MCQRTCFRQFARCKLFVMQHCVVRVRNPRLKPSPQLLFYKEYIINVNIPIFIKICLKCPAGRKRNLLSGEEGRSKRGCAFLV